jgi:hypothetical protein
VAHFLRCFDSLSGQFHPIASQETVADLFTFIILFFNEVDDLRLMPLSVIVSQFEVGV